jgi:hypothetical protein
VRERRVVPEPVEAHTPGSDAAAGIPLGEGVPLEGRVEGDAEAAVVEAAQVPVRHGADEDAIANGFHGGREAALPFRRHPTHELEVDLEQRLAVAKRRRPPRRGSVLPGRRADAARRGGIERTAPRYRSWLEPAVVEDEHAVSSARNRTSTSRRGTPAATRGHGPSEPRVAAREGRFVTTELRRAPATTGADRQPCESVGAEPKAHDQGRFRDPAAGGTSRAPSRVKRTTVTAAFTSARIARTRREHSRNSRMAVAADGSCTRNTGEGDDATGARGGRLQ